MCVCVCVCVWARAAATPAPPPSSPPPTLPASLLRQVAELQGQFEAPPEKFAEQLQLVYGRYLQAIVADEDDKRPKQVPYLCLTFALPCRHEDDQRPSPPPSPSTR